MFEMVELKEKLGDFPFLKNKDLNDRTEWRKSCEDNLIGDFNDDSIVDANKENFWWCFFELSLSFFHIVLK